MAPAYGAATLNGWDTDNIYIIRTHIYTFGEPEVPGNSIQIVTESNLIPDKPLTRFGTFLTYSDAHPKTFTFSNSPLAGTNTPAGARMFLAEAAPGNSRKLDIEIYEFNSAGQVLRKSSLGSTFGPGTGQLVLASQSNNSVAIGCIRYNPKKNTLAVSATLNTDDGGTTRGKAFEFALPDWPANGGAGFVAVTPVQVYEAPTGHSIYSGDYFNIDFDDDGNMYMAGKSFNANTTGDNFKGDVIRVNTIGRNGGTSTYVVPITGANSDNLLIEGAIEPEPDYDNIQSLAVRTVNHSVILLTKTDDVVGEPDLEYDLTTRAPNGNLVLVHNWYSYPNEFGLNSEVYHGQRDYDSGGVFISCGRGEPGGGPKVIYASGSIGVIGYRNWDSTSPPPIPLVPFSADNDNDGDVDQVDFSAFQLCYAPALTVATFNCRRFDSDQDNDVDTVDFAVYLPCMSGPNHAKPPGC